MTAAGEVLAAEIAREGTIPFRRFMEVALYHPEHGYYRRGRDPFGKEGDFYTAEQIQPVFGILMATFIRELYRKMDKPRDFSVTELGAGRGEMAEAFAEWPYCPVDLVSGELPGRPLAGRQGALLRSTSTSRPMQHGDAVLPESFTGVVFSNEFFDALPVHVAVYRHGAFLEQRVACEGGAFVWHTGGPVAGEVEEYLRRYFPPPEEGRWYEANLDGLRWMERIGQTLASGYVVTIDYGFTRAESVRFPTGTLMGYRRHIACENVLEEPGERDITSHVNFTAIEEAGASLGLRPEIFETLAKILLRAGEADQFAAALAGGPGTELRRRMQLKTLLFGMGETFRVLVQRREAGK